MTPKQTLTTGSLCLLTSLSLHGAGFQLQERSTVGLGRAFSGEAAIADDASVIASNPAGMILLDGTSVSAGLSYIRPGAKARGNNVAAGNATANSNDVGDEVVVPAFYISHRVNDDLAVGLGSFTTYGLSTDYDFGPAGASLPDTSTLESVNLQLSAAYRLNSKLTIGAGFNILYADGTINSSPAAPGAGRLATIEGDDFGYGYNVGLLYEHSERTRFGLHYRSKIDLKLEGETSTDAPLPTLSNLDTILSTTLPETIEFSAYHELNESWAIHGDIILTRWSRYNGLAPITSVGPVNNALAAEGDPVWKDVFRFSVGATHKYSDDLTLRAGIAFDRSPVSEESRNLRIPDQDRLWLSIGASYAISENYNFDIGYTRIFIEDADITPGPGQPFSGEVSGDVDILSVGISGSF